MYPSIVELQDILVKEDYLSLEDSQKVQAASKDSAEYIDHLIRQELLSKPLLGQALAESFKLPFADLGSYPPGKDQVAMIPEQDARTLRIVIAKYSDDLITIATDSPGKADAQKLANSFQGKKVQLAYTLPEYINAALELYEQPLATRFSQIIQSGQRVAPEIVDEIIKDALGFRASDIHFEPRGDKVSVRFRVDGSLREAGVLPREYYDNVLNRIKVEGGMRIDEHLSSQDGAVQRQLGDSKVDLRVSLVPTVEGEKIVMRVLGSYVQGFAMSDVGLGDAHRAILEASAAKPFGMIFFKFCSKCRACPKNLARCLYCPT